MSHCRAARALENLQPRENLKVAAPAEKPMLQDDCRMRQARPHELQVARCHGITADFYPYDMSFLARKRPASSTRPGARATWAISEAKPHHWSGERAGIFPRAPSALDLHRDRRERRQRQRERGGKSMAGIRRRCDASYIAHV
jgi:hypothetical protein